MVWILALYILVRAALAAQAMPDTSARQWQAALGLGLAGFHVLLVAWWLRGDPRRIALLGGMAIAGLCTEILVEGRWADLEQVLRGNERHMVGSALPMGLLGGLGLLVIVSGLPVALERAQRHSRVALVVVAVGALLATILLAALQIITQSRAIVGMLTVLVPAVVIVQLLQTAGDRRRRRMTTVIAAVLALVLGAMLALVGPKLIDRMDREAGAGVAVY
ncbi:MAG: hypothetical protein U5K33_04910 [Halofilum sp. (in: g-proteobacteria)]|nr:hypothetical protein [Halofilum sp. (in: g-proteobacteria)]